jgi:hypothetical protein
LKKLPVYCLKEELVVNQTFVLHTNPPQRILKIANLAKPKNVVTSKRNSVNTQEYP